MLSTENFKDYTERKNPHPMKKVKNDSSSSPARPINVIHHLYFRMPTILIALTINIIMGDIIIFYIRFCCACVQIAVYHETHFYAEQRLKK